MHSTQATISLLLVGSALLLATGGCPGQPPSASVLRGTWDVAVDETVGLQDTQISIDLLGQVSEVTTKLAERERTLTPTSSTSSVEDQAVDIVATFPVGQLDLVGTLDETGDVITGLVTLTNDVDPAVSVIDVPVVLTRNNELP